MISVIIPVYNGQEYIERSLKSVLKQSRFDLIKEIILVDDGSTDNTAKFAKKIYSDLIIVKKKNGGCESAKNLGINFSKSEFVCFLDVDDYWHEDKIKIQAENYTNNPNFDIFVCNAFSISGEKNLGIRFNKEKIFCDKITKGGAVTISNYIKPEGRYSFHPPSTLMVKKKVFLDLGFHDEDQKQGGDSEIFLRWVINNCKIYFNSEPLTFYETNNQNSLTKNLEQWSKFHFLYWQKIKFLKLNIKDQKKFLLMRKNTLLGSIMLVIKNGRNVLARKLIIENFKLLHCSKLYIYFLISFLPISSFKKIFLFKR